MTSCDSCTHKVTLASVWGMDWTGMGELKGITTRRILQGPGQRRGWIGPELQWYAEDRWPGQGVLEAG